MRRSFKIKESYYFESEYLVYLVYLININIYFYQFIIKLKIFYLKNNRYDPFDAFDSKIGEIIAKL
jgi:hypothetical protein